MPVKILMCSVAVLAAEEAAVVNLTEFLLMKTVWLKLFLKK
eukprot:IDg11488t1